MPSTTSNDLNTSAKWDESNETHDGYKAWVNKGQQQSNGMDYEDRQTSSRTAKLGKTAWKALGVLHSQIMAQRQPVCQQQSDGMDYEVRQTSSRSAKLQTSVSRAPPLREQFLDEAQAAREELLAEIQRSAESDAGEDPAEDKQADDVTFGHKMMYPSEPDWNVTSDEFADEDLASLLRGDGKKKIDLVASMHMLKLQCLTAKLGPSTIAWNDKSAMHVPDKTTLGVLDSQIMA